MMKSLRCLATLMVVLLATGGGECLASSFSWSSYQAAAEREIRARDVTRAESHVMQAMQLAISDPAPNAEKRSSVNAILKDVAMVQALMNERLELALQQSGGNKRQVLVDSLRRAELLNRQGVIMSRKYFDANDAGRKSLEAEYANLVVTINRLSR